MWDICRPIRDVFAQVFHSPEYHLDTDYMDFLSLNDPLQQIFQADTQDNSRIALQNQKTRTYVNVDRNIA